MPMDTPLTMEEIRNALPNESDITPIAAPAVSESNIRINVNPDKMEEEPPSVPGSPTYPTSLSEAKFNRPESSSNPSFSPSLHRQNSFDSTAGTIGSPHPSLSSMDNPFSPNIGSFRLQSLLVMRHSERLDDVDQSWVATSGRPWDPPITDSGKILAFETGKKLRSEGWNISRIICSPFLRCVQTAAELACALSAVDWQTEGEGSRGVVIDPSKVKISIDYGLGEVMNQQAFRLPHDFISPEISNSINTLPLEELESILPRGMFDHAATSSQTELAKFPELLEDSHLRFMKTFDAIAEKYPKENIVCVTHGEAVSVSVSRVTPVLVHSVNFCAYSWSQRVVFYNSNSSSSLNLTLSSLNSQAEDTDVRGFGDWELLTEPETTGISWLT